MYVSSLICLIYITSVVDSLLMVTSNVQAPQSSKASGISKGKRKATEQPQKKVLKKKGKTNAQCSQDMPYSQFSTQE